MPLVSEECPHCGKGLHTDDLIDGTCLEQSGGCGDDLPEEVAW